jgi:hypothetical protein
MHCPHFAVTIAESTCRPDVATQTTETLAQCAETGHDRPLPDPNTSHYIFPIQPTTTTTTTTTTKKFWEEPIAYFPLIRHGPHRRRRLQQLFAAMGTCLPSRCLTNDMGHTETQSLSFDTTSSRTTVSHRSL